MDAQRDRSVSPGIRSHSRGRQYDSDHRSLSRARISDGVKWSILSHDPSERLIKKEPELNDESADNYEEVSEEEQISDSDNEFQYDDGGTLLPNFATYHRSDNYTGKHESKLDDANSATAASDALQEATSKISELAIAEDSKEDKIVKEARKVARLQEIQAAQSALENAVAVGAPIPSQTLEMVKSLSEDELQYIDVDLLKKHSQHAGTIQSELLGKPQPKKVSEGILKKYATYKSKITAYGNDRNFNAPYTNDSELEQDLEFAKKLNENIDISEIDSNKENARCLRTITRGDFFKNLQKNKKPSTYLICMDFSPESIYALEWCIGTVVSNNSVIFIVYVIEEDRENATIAKDLNGLNEQEKEKTRKEGIEKLTENYLDLIKLTKLQTHAVIEVIHHPIPRHLITEIIDHISPTLVVVGSRGKSALQGVLLGSLSNYLVTKSSVPVMVVRKELKKTLKKKKTPNNFALVHSLKEARVD